MSLTYLMSGGRPAIDCPRCGQAASLRLRGGRVAIDRALDRIGRDLERAWAG